ncbi:hypothetical protein Tco_1562986 [Tanacetum coccineum]
MNNQVKLEESNARFDKWKESSKKLVKLINSSMSSRSKFGLGYGDTLGSDEVFDLSAPRTFMPPSNKPDIDDTQFTYGSKSNNYSESNSVSNEFVCYETSDKSSDSETTGFASCALSVNSSSTMTNASNSVDLKTLHKTDDQGPCNVTQSPSFSFKENVKTPRNLCNKEKLADFVKIKGGTVTFGGGDGKITGKGTIRTSNFNFENVYYVEELQNFNLFSVSQICDTKNKVFLQTKSAYVLSQEFHNYQIQVKADEGTQDTNTHAGTHDDSDSECDESVIVVPSFPSNHFSGLKVHIASAIVESTSDYAEELARLQGQAYDAYSAAKDTWKTADTVPAGSGVPATSIPAGSINQAAVVLLFLLLSSFFCVEPVHSEYTTFHLMEGIHHHPTTGIFSESTYDVDFGGSPINLIACRPKKNVNFAARMAAIIAERRRKFAAQRFQDKKNKPMTYAQQRDYIRTFVKNQSSTIYTTGWTLKHVRSFSDDQLKVVLTDQTSSLLKSAITTPKGDSRPSSAGVTPDVHQSPFVDTPPSTPPHSPKASSHPDVTPDTSKQPTVAPTPSFATPVSRSFGPRTRSQSSDTVLSDDDYDASDDDTDPLFWHIFAAWEVIPTGLGDVNALYFTDKSSKYFTHLREILHLIDRHICLNTPYPLSASLMKKMLKHKLEVETDGIGNDMTYVVQLIKITSRITCFKCSLCITPGLYQNELM